MKILGLLCVALFTPMTLALDLNPEGDKPNKPITVTGKLLFDCGPTHGTGCFIINTQNKEAYAIGGYFPDLPEGALEKLQHMNDEDKLVTVSGQLMKKKFNGYKAFDLSYSLEVK